MKQTLATALVCSHSTTAREVIGIDLGDRWSRYCVLDPAGTAVEEDRARTAGGASSKIRAAASDPHGD
jgi:hypothetical protein